MTIGLLDLHCLNALCDDFEDFESIRSEIRRAVHGDVSKEEIEECVRQLVRHGLATAFTFDAGRSAYVRGDLDGDLSSRWFLISDQGRRELEQNWVDE